MSADAAGSTLSTSDGRKVVLGALIKSGGAGSVYRMRDTANQVAKLYHAGIDLKVYERKIAAMLELEPQLPELVQDGTRYVQLAWPDAALRDARGRFVGYLMPVVDIDATSELELVLQERQARRMNLPTGLGAKVTLAANLCAVIAALHRQRHYIVDLKPVNLRFYRQSLYMAMLDCDGFSIQGRGERFEAPQYTPDYLAPEFHARGLNVAGEAQQDRFALAVVVFQLLNFGIHPFTGRPQSNQVPTDVPGRIAGRWYAHGIQGNASLLPAPASGHASMPAELRVLFDRAFDDRTVNSGGASRPSADDWSTVLRGYAQRAAGKLKACARDATHQHFVGQDCAACARVAVLAGAQAAAARKPPAPPIARRPPVTVRVPGRAPAPVPATAAKPGSTTRRIPPNVMARINQAWAKRAPAPVRRPANWPAPPPPPAYPTSGGSSTSTIGTWVQMIFVAAWLLILGAIGLFNVIQDWSEDRRTAAEAPQRIAAAKAQQEANRALQAHAGSANLRPPGPGWGAMNEQASQVQVLASAVAEGNDYAVMRSLATLRARSRNRQQSWRRTLEQANSTGIDTRHAAPPTAVADAAAASRRAGWQALANGQREQAERHFADALWGDADAADAWLGYGLSSANAQVALGTTAIGILQFPDATAARESRRQLTVGLAWVDARRKQDVNVVLDRAGPIAERLRTRLPAGTVPMADPFAWVPP